MHTGASGIGAGCTPCSGSVCSCHLRSNCGFSTGSGSSPCSPAFTQATPADYSRMSPIRFLSLLPPPPPPKKNPYLSLWALRPSWTLRSPSAAVGWRPGAKESRRKDGLPKKRFRLILIPHSIFAKTVSIPHCLPKTVFPSDSWFSARAALVVQTAS